MTEAGATGMDALGPHPHLAHPRAHWARGPPAHWWPVLLNPTLGSCFKHGAIRGQAAAFKSSQLLCRGHNHWPQPLDATCVCLR